MGEGGREARRDLFKPLQAFTWLFAEEFYLCEDVNYPGAASTDVTYLRYPRLRCGRWFDLTQAKVFLPLVETEEHAHQLLYKTRKGSWILCEPGMPGEKGLDWIYRKLPDDDAEKWLCQNGHRGVYHPDLEA